MYREFHNNGLIYGNLKPSNVLISEENEKALKSLQQTL